eukprot:11256242-Karenia_brevis.AAC.1
MSLLPKDYREEVLKMGSGDKKLEYDQVRGYVISLAQQRGSAMTPKPNDVMGIDDQEVGNSDSE